MKIKADIDRLVDVFGGSDGGGEFLMFKVAAESIEAQADEGEEASAEIIRMIQRFRRLVDAMIVNAESRHTRAKSGSNKRPKGRDAGRK